MVVKSRVPCLINGQMCPASDLLQIQVVGSKNRNVSLTYFILEIVECYNEYKWHNETMLITKTAVSCDLCGVGHNECNSDCFWKEDSAVCLPLSRKYGFYTILHG